MTAERLARVRAERLVRLNTASRELGVTPKTVKRYCECGHLKCKRLATGHWRVYRSSLDAAKR